MSFKFVLFGARHHESEFHFAAMPLPKGVTTTTRTCRMDRCHNYRSIDGYGGGEGRLKMLI